jgi:hypothetical protein
MSTTCSTGRAPALSRVRRVGPGTYSYAKYSWSPISSRE